MRQSYIFIICAFAFSIVVGAVVFMKVPFFIFNGFEKALEGVLLLTSISLGFYGACLCVLASIFNTKIVKEIMDDGDYRQEFIAVCIVSLLVGFLTAITTIVYQVFLENGAVTFAVMNIVNSVWIALFVLFLCFSLLFVVITFLIFFKNSDEKGKVHSGKIQNQNF